MNSVDTEFAGDLALIYWGAATKDNGYYQEGKKSSTGESQSELNQMQPLPSQLGTTTRLFIS